MQTYDNPNAILKRMVSLILNAKIKRSVPSTLEFAYKFIIRGENLQDIQRSIRD